MPQAGANSDPRDTHVAILEWFPNPIWRSTVNGKCDYFNAAWLQFTGRDLEQELGDGWAESVHPDDLDQCMGIWIGALAKRQPFEMEYRLRRADGRYRWILDRGAPFHTADGEFAGYIGTCYDVTDAKEGAHLREDLIHLVTHQLRSPLTAVLGLAQLLEAGVISGAEDVSAAGGRIADGARAMDALVDELLTVARWESGEMPLNLQDIDPVAFSREVVAVCEAPSRVRVKTPRRARMISADPKRLAYSLANLLQNALKYSPPDKDVTLALRQEGSTTVFSVSDRGSGIPAQETERLFGRFQRSETSGEGGYGLGLYLTSKLVAAHGGRVEVESEPQQGSTFRIILPA